MNTGLQPGDGILIVGDERSGFRRQRALGLPDRQPGDAVRRCPPIRPTRGYTLVSWELGLGEDRDPGVSPSQVDPASTPSAGAPRCSVTTRPIGGPCPATSSSPSTPPGTSGHPDLRKTQWPDFELPSSGDPVVDLDAYYPRILPGSWIVLDGPSYTELYRVESVEPCVANGLRDLGEDDPGPPGRQRAPELVRPPQHRRPRRERRAADGRGAGHARRSAAGRSSSRRPVTQPAAGQFLVVHRPAGGRARRRRCRVTEVADRRARDTESARTISIRLTRELAPRFDPADLDDLRQRGPSDPRRDRRPRGPGRR